MTATVTPRRVPRDPSPDAQRRVRRPGLDLRPAPEPELAPDQTELERPPLRVVTAANRRSRRDRLGRRTLRVSLALAVLATPFALVLVHVELTAKQLELTRLQNQGDQAQVTYEKLRLKVATLDSPARIVSTAQQLGMVTPTTITYLNAPASATSGPATTVPPPGPGLGGWTSAKSVDRSR